MPPKNHAPLFSAERQGPPMRDYMSAFDLLRQFPYTDERMSGVKRLGR